MSFQYRPHILFHLLLEGLSGDEETPDPYQCFVDADIVGDDVGVWKIGVRQMLQSELNSYTTKTDLPNSVPGKHCNNCVGASVKWSFRASNNTQVS